MFLWVNCVHGWKIGNPTNRFLMTWGNRFLLGLWSSWLGQLPPCLGVEIILGHVVIFMCKLAVWFYIIPSKEALPRSCCPHHLWDSPVLSTGHLWVMSWNSNIRCWWVKTFVIPMIDADRFKIRSIELTHLMDLMLHHLSFHLPLLNIILTLLVLQPPQYSMILIRDPHQLKLPLLTIQWFFLEWIRYNSWIMAGSTYLLRY